MPSPRLRRRLVRHHLVLALASAMALVLLVWLVPSNDPKFRWSMATAYVGLALLGLSLATGPLNVVRGRPNPVSTDLRRDIGIWAGILSILHFVVGWQVHMKHRYLYWLREVKETGGLVVRTDLFGFANHTGLAAVLVAALLLALSNDRSLRALGTPRWKGLQRWNYALIVLVAAHGVAYQVVEKRKAPFVVAFAVMLLIVAAVQFAGYRARRDVVRTARARGSETNALSLGETP
jgi:methionine sulfoxide reductase heme-binding subunit